MESEFATDIHFFPPIEGVSIKDLNSLSIFYDRVRARGETTHVVAIKDELFKEIATLHKQSKNIDPDGAKKTINRIYKLVIAGIQDSYDTMFFLCLILKKFCDVGNRYVRRFGAQFDDNQFKKYNEYLGIMEKHLHDMLTVRYNEAVKAALGKEVFVAKLKTTGLYRLFNKIVPQIAEEWSMKQAAKRTLKEEKKIGSIEEHSKPTHRELMKLLLMDKKYTQDFVHVMTRSSIYWTLIIQNAREAVNAIRIAITGITLPPSYDTYARRILYILEKRTPGALKSIERSLLQLEDSIRELKAHLNAAHLQAQKEKEAVKA